MEEKTKICQNLEQSVVYNLPKSWIINNNFIIQLSKLEAVYFDVSLMPAPMVTLDNSCHLCLPRYQSIKAHELCLVFLHRSKDEFLSISEKLKQLNEGIEIEMICQSKFNKGLYCPLIMEQQAIDKDREVNVLKMVENWFSDEEIFKHKDILVSMNNGGWVPITLLSSKLQHLIYLPDSELVTRLNQSELLITKENFVRRINPILPITDEFKKILLLDIPDTIKSIKQLPMLLKINDSTVESFDYGTHSALLSVNSRSEAEKIVEESATSSPIQYRLLVPNIIESHNACITAELKAQCNNINKLLTNLALNEDVEGEIHVSRLEPSELTYTFPSDFSPPSKDVVKRIVKQCNFYFSDANVLKDLFILKKIKASCGGWIDIDIISKFKLMITLSNDSVDNIVYAMCSSDQVQISRNGKSLRRRLPLPDWDSSIYTRSLFLWRLPRYCQSFETLDTVFRDEGRFKVNICRFINSTRNVPADLRKLVDKVPALGREDCGVIEFGDRDSMLGADAYIHMKWPSIKTFYLDIKSDLPKPAVIVGRSTRCLAPPIPIVDTTKSVLSSLQTGTRIDPRFWKAAQIFNSKKREEYKDEVPKIKNNKEFSALTKDTLKDNTNSKNLNLNKPPVKGASMQKKWSNIHINNVSNENKKPVS